MHICLALLASLTMTLISLSASATADGPDCWRVVGVKADDTLNLRLKGNSEAEIIAKIKHDATGLKNLGCAEPPAEIRAKAMSGDSADYKKWRKKFRWCKIGFEGTTGFVHGNYLGEGTCKTKE
ncbi:MAG: hypothetical protein HRT45_12380 [Bdellovibrionales bacterium]|nr:hypothetical protein [Bdellovibrionales bacterium]